jgi:hypothetical protein
MASQVDEPTTWIVLTRDLSDVVEVEDSPGVIVSVVLDLATGLVRGTSMGPTASQARVPAMVGALTRPVEPFASTPAPVAVLCPTGERDSVSVDLAAAFAQAGVGKPDLPSVTEADFPPEVTGVLDELVDMLQRGMGPLESPEPEDWRLLVQRTWAFAEAEPWLTWPDELQLRLDLTIDGVQESFVAAVIGREGMQAGLVLYPGEDHSAVLIPDDDWQPDDPLPFEPGSLLLHLNPPDDTVEEMSVTAVAHGWPADAPVMPVWLSASPEGFAELERAQALLLSLALAGVMARDHRPLDTRSAPITGTLALPGGEQGRYAVTDLE